MPAREKSGILKAKQSLPFIDMLRGFAALWVVLFHVRVDLWIGLQELRAHPDRYGLLDQLLGILSIPAYFGGGGVMLFFLVSGFCIHLPHVGDRSVPWREYVARRFWRIYPPYLVAVAFTVACETIAVRVFGAPTGISSSPHVAETAFMLQNYAAGGAQLIGNPSLWSLPVEVELYLAYPLFLLLIDRLGTKAALLAAAAVSAAATVAYLAGTSKLHYNFAHYWLIWCSGAWLADSWRKDGLPRFRWWFVAALLITAALACWLRLRDVSFALQNYGWAATYFFLMLIGLLRPDWVAAIPKLIAWPLIRTGAFSYSLYLIHFPTFFLAGAIWVWAFGSKPVSFLVPLTAALLVIPMAWLFYRWTELPSLRFGRDLARRRLAPVAVEG